MIITTQAFKWKFHWNGDFAEITNSTFKGEMRNHNKQTVVKIKGKAGIFVCVLLRPTRSVWICSPLGPRSRDRQYFSDWRGAMCTGKQSENVSEFSGR